MGRKPRSANERLSALVAEAGVSHKGLARRVVKLGDARGVRGLAYDHTSVLRWLAGQEPREPVPALLADVLSDLVGRPVSVADLGMVPGGLSADLGLELTTGWPDCVATATTLWRADVERRRFLADSAVAVSASAAVALRWLVSPAADLPQGGGSKIIGTSDVAGIREVTRSYRELDNKLGGGRLRRAVVTYLDTEVAPMLAGGRYGTEAGRELAAAAAELAQLAGWMAFDSGMDGRAQRHLTQALNLARHAGAAGLGGEILAAKAQQAVYLGRPGEAVDMARVARVTARQASLPTLETECLVMEAHGHAAIGDARACAKALTDAEVAFGRSARQDDPVWLRYFDEAYLAARMAHCFHALGDAGHAECYARRSLVMDGRFVRGKAFNLSLLATALAEQGEVEHACAIGGQALDLVSGLQSARSVRYPGPAACAEPPRGQRRSASVHLRCQACSARASIAC
jgi:hypothetical protein